MSEETHFISFNDDGDIVIDREALHKRLKEEGLEEALERDDVKLNLSTSLASEISDDEEIKYE